MTQHVRSALSHWGPWMIVAYFGIVAVIVALFFVNSNTIKEDAARSAATSRCLSSRPTLLKFQTHIRGVSELAHVLVTNSRKLLEQTPRRDPDHAVRKANLRRITAARRKINALPTFHVPTVAECNKAKP